MGPEGAANIIFRNEIASAADPDAFRKQKVAEYTEKFANPYVAAAAGHIDAVITPKDTRDFLIHAIQIAGHKTESRPVRKHGIPPF
jgi:acetyl-CoA carboxylase carboxyltransferase component